MSQPPPPPGPPPEPEPSGPPPPPSGQPPYGQPPYGQPPYGQPQNPYGPPPPAYGAPNPYAPYSAPNPYAPPGAPYGAPPRPKSSNRSLWLIFGIIGGVLLLCCGGVFGFVIWGANEVNDAIDDATKGQTPHEVTEGESFDQGGYTAESGWRVANDGVGDFTIKKLRITNHRQPDTAFWTFTVYKDGEQLGAIDCFSNQLQSDETGPVTCVSTDDYTADYDTVKVANEF